ncbi:MAG: ATP-binding protein [Kofleriaceae bacterium]
MHDDDEFLLAETISGVVAMIEPDQTTPTHLDAHLVCVTGPGLGTTFALGRTTAIIGRANADVLLAENDVSRQHASLTWTPGGYVLDDLDSSNGTLLNGARIVKPRTVKLGDRIQIGRSVLVLSQRDELAQRVARVQRLETIATLAGGLAHDINNSLFVVLANLEALVEDLPELATNRSANELRAGAEVAVGLAKRLLRLGRTEALPLTSVPLEDLVRRAAAMASRRASSPLDVRIDIAADLDVRGVYDELHHVFLNLFLNAIDAMPAGGTLTITAHATADAATVLVADTGCGMDEQTRGRIFEPFFTTKPSDKGTGLGLAMIDSTIRRHHGSIAVSSRLGKGTTFTITLPRL